MKVLAWIGGIVLAYWAFSSGLAVAIATTIQNTLP